MPFEAEVEFGVGFHVEPGCQIRSSEIEATHPAFQELVGCGEQTHCLARVVFLEREFTLDQLGVSLSLRVQLGSKAIRQCACLLSISCFNENPGHEETDVYLLRVEQGAFGSFECCRLMSPH